MQSDAKFLAVPNWDKYQPKLKNGKPGRQWIRLDCNLEDDDVFDSLTTFQKWVCVGIWRIRARTGKNVPNDPVWIRRALHLRVTNETPDDVPGVRQVDDRSVTRRVHRAVDRLTSFGLLVLCNQQIEVESAPRDKTLQDVTKEQTYVLKPPEEPAASHVTDFQLQPPGSNGHSLLPLIREVWDFYLKTFNKNPKINTLQPARIKCAERCLKLMLEKTEGDKEQAVLGMCGAITAISKSAFHNGSNESGAKYLSWEKHIFKTTTKFEEWLDKAREKGIL